MQELRIWREEDHGEHDVRRISRWNDGRVPGEYLLGLGDELREAFEINAIVW